MALKSFTFGGVNSLDYGVGITGAGVYSAPERDVEIIEVQGRNGNYILDNGRFHNIEVTYPAVMGDTTQGTFAQKIADFRNAMLSQVGYQRLEDEYNPDEFRLGACVGGLDVDPDENSMAGEFDVKFNCKPQRFLKSGETEVPFPEGGPSSPNLLVYPYYNTTKTTNGITFTDNGDGTITVNGTATARTEFTFRSRPLETFTLNTGTYILSGCPNGGGANTYGININRTVNGASAVYGNDYGSGLNFTVTDDTATTGVQIVINNGQTVSNLTFKPMICLESEYTGKWIPYWNPATQIYNPTSFPSSPLLMVEGYGDINLGDEVVTIQDSPMGEILVASRTTVTGKSINSVAFNTTFYYTGDSGRTAFRWTDRVRLTNASSITNYTISAPSSITVQAYEETENILAVIATVSDYSFTVGQGSVTYNVSLIITYEDTGGTEQTETVSLAYRMSFYDSSISQTASNSAITGVYVAHSNMTIYDTYVDSTYSSLGNPLYLDLENGQAYKYDDNDNYVSVNNAVWLGAELPTLKSGVTTITYDEDIHDLKIVPRWWKI